MKRDLTNQKFGRLTVIKPNGIASNRCIKWLCRCECGNYVTVSSDNLVRGKSTSCGCIRHVHKNLSAKYPKLYIVWNDMKQRCYNPNNRSYKNYGGREIKMCKDWLNFETFVNWALSSNYNSTLMIDRINNDGNYEPNNCRWVTQKVQNNNRRSNHLITYNGETHNVTEWATKLNILPVTLLSRLKAGWTVERALTTPTKKHK